MLMNGIIGCFSGTAPLSEEDHDVLGQLSPERIEFVRNSVVFRQGEPADQLLLVETGLAFTCRHLEDGSRQIIDIHFPGELIGLDELSQPRHLSGLMTLTDAVMLSFNRDDVVNTCSQSPSLSQLLLTMVSSGQAMLTERMVGLARHSARQRVAHFLLEVRFRVGRGKYLRSDTAHVYFPQNLDTRNFLRPCGVLRIPQAIIADALGLSIVHVSRVLRELREQDLICTCGQGIALSNVDGLKEIAGWKPGEHWYEGQPVLAVGAGCFQA